MKAPRSVAQRSAYLVSLFLTIFSLQQVHRIPESYVVRINVFWKWMFVVILELKTKDDENYYRCKYEMLYYA